MLFSRLDQSDELICIYDGPISLSLFSSRDRCYAHKLRRTYSNGYIHLFAFKPESDV